MSVYLRGSHWHYRFMMSGKSYSGPCLGCENEKQAEAYEKQKRSSACVVTEEINRAKEDVRKNRTIVALVENYRRELSGGTLIAISDAYALASKKPSRRAAGAFYANLRETYWKAFCTFLSQNFPDVKLLSEIRRSHCEAFVKYLQDTDRSPKTIREYVAACKWIIGRLEEDAGIIRSPWTGVVLPESNPTTREVFTMDELAAIWDGLQNDPFCKPLFIIAANSGMTEGDICTLKWSEIDFRGGMIRRTRRKTGVQILLPLLPELANYLRSIPKIGEYVLPEHARRYLANRTSVSRHVKNFLESIGIKTCVQGKLQRVSVKDLHSMRHIFCYRAKKAGIPESTIQKMVGHAVLEMTRHYADHDTEDDLRRQIQKLPALFVEGQGANQGEVEDRRKLAELIPSLPIEVVRRWLGELSQALPEP